MRLEGTIAAFMTWLVLVLHIGSSHQHDLRLNGLPCAASSCFIPDRGYQLFRA